MNKNISWKGSLLIAIICYFITFTMSAYLGRVIPAVLEIVGLITLVLGIIGGFKAIIYKMKDNKSK